MLTSEGKELIEKMQPVWELMSKILGDIADNENNLLKAIDELKRKLQTSLSISGHCSLKFKINNTISILNWKLPATFIKIYNVEYL